MLFSSTDIHPSEDRAAIQSFGYRPVSQFAYITAGTPIASALPSISDGYTYHLPCFVNWSLHDVLQRILELTGPAHVCMTSWAISEEPARKISRMVTDGMILSMHCLFDHRVTRYCPSAMQLVSGSMGKIKLTNIHAKLLTVHNDKWGISVTSTANATNKRRVEKYVVACDRAVADFERDWIIKLINE